MLRRFLKYASIMVLMNYIGLSLMSLQLTADVNPFMLGFIMMIPILPMNLITAFLICMLDRDEKNAGK